MSRKHVLIAGLGSLCLLAAIFYVAVGVRHVPYPPSEAVVNADLPIFTFHKVLLEYEDLKYNPTDDIIVPSIISTDNISNPLGKYYMYYAPHDAPGGISLAYAEQVEGPWTEYHSNPIVSRRWDSHHDVSHVSGPEVIFIEEEGKYFLYYHGENDTTRFATSSDGINFHYEGVAVDKTYFDDVIEASYAKIFTHRVDGRDNKYTMLLMGNNADTRRIYYATSNDGRIWDAHRQPLISPPTANGQIALASILNWRGQLLAIYHNYAREGTSLHVSMLSSDFESVKYVGMIYDHRMVSRDNPAVMNIFLLEDADRILMAHNYGTHQNQNIALSIAPKKYMLVGDYLIFLK